MKMRMVVAVLAFLAAGLTVEACGGDDKENLPCDCECQCQDDTTMQSEGKSEEDCDDQCYEFCGGEDQAFGTGSVCIE